jgi:hypothetical protein
MSTPPFSLPHPYRSVVSIESFLPVLGLVIDAIMNVAEATLADLTAVCGRGRIEAVVVCCVFGHVQSNWVLTPETPRPRIKA